MKLTLKQLREVVESVMKEGVPPRGVYAPGSYGADSCDKCGAMLDPDDHGDSHYPNHYCEDCMDSFYDDDSSDDVSDYETCSECGYDHEYEFEKAQEWHREELDGTHEADHMRDRLKDRDLEEGRVVVLTERQLRQLVVQEMKKQ